FRLVGRTHDAGDLALQLLSSLQGAMLLAHSFGDPSLLEREGERLTRWLAELELTRPRQATASMCIKLGGRSRWDPNPRNRGWLHRTLIGLIPPPPEPASRRHHHRSHPAAAPVRSSGQPRR